MSKKEKYKQFLVKDGFFCPTTNVQSIGSIEAGVYELSQEFMGSNIYFIPKNITTDSFIEMRSMVTTQIVKEIENFWRGDTKEKFNTFGITYKRGILMHGAPGTGKTSTIFKVINKVVEMGGIAIYNPTPNLFSNAIQALRDIQGDCKVVCVFEEFDKYCNDADFLSLLDGELQVPNVVYVATTNHIDKIPDALKKRPSRFARVIEVGKPDLAARTEYIRLKLPSLTPKELNHWAKKTEGFVIDQIKDVVLSVACFGYSFNESCDNVRSLGVKAFGLAQGVEDESDDGDDTEDE